MRQKLNEKSYKKNQTKSRNDWEKWCQLFFLFLFEEQIIQKTWKIRNKVIKWNISVLDVNFNFWIPCHLLTQSVGWGLCISCPEYPMIFVFSNFHPSFLNLWSYNFLQWPQKYSCTFFWKCIVQPSNEPKYRKGNQQNKKNDDTPWFRLKTQNWLNVSVKFWLKSWHQSRKNKHLYLSKKYIIQPWNQPKYR